MATRERRRKCVGAEAGESLAARGLVHQHALLPVDGDLVLLFGASLLGSAHCVGMCGPYVAMCTAQLVPRGTSPAARFLLRALFNLGRLGTYTLIGLIVGAFGQILLAFAARAGLTGMVAIAAGIAAVSFGLSLIGFVKDPARIAGYAGLGRLLGAGRTRLQQASPLVAAAFLGMIQGWLPCALVYGAASRAAVAGSGGMGALTMLIFGLGTVPAVFALSIVPQAVLRRVKTRCAAGVLFTALGALLILRGLASFGLVPATGLW